ncbi:hypothetical protein GH141_08450 [bacterium]|nr:hypothetical protein [bacterium]
MDVTPGLYNHVSVSNINYLHSQLDIPLSYPILKRVLPEGFPGRVRESAVRFFEEIIVSKIQKPKEG